MDILDGNDSIESTGSIQFSETLTNDRESQTMESILLIQSSHLQESIIFSYSLVMERSRLEGFKNRFLDSDHQVVRKQARSPGQNSLNYLL